jgi:hypothetical protein
VYSDPRVTKDAEWTLPKGFFTPARFFVTVHVTVDEAGNPLDVTFDQFINRGLEESIRDAALHSEYQPARTNQGPRGGVATLQYDVPKTQMLSQPAVLQVVRWSMPRNVRTGSGYQVNARVNLDSTGNIVSVAIDDWVPPPISQAIRAGLTSTRFSPAVCSTGPCNGSLQVGFQVPGDQGS